MLFSILAVFPLKRTLIGLECGKASVQGRKECFMLIFTLENLVLALMTPSVNGMQ